MSGMRGRANRERGLRSQGPRVREVWHLRAVPGFAQRFRLDAALPPILELERQIGEFGRGERDSPF